MVKAKQYWKSKVFWFSIIQLLCGATLAVLNQYELAGTLTTTSILGIALRYYTKNPIKF